MVCGNGVYEVYFKGKRVKSVNTEIKLPAEHLKYTKKIYGDTLRAEIRR